MLKQTISLLNLFLFSFFCLAAGNAIADSVSDEHSTESFWYADNNNDGVVDEAEFGADVAAAFSSVDANHDGRLSADEIGADLSHEMAGVDANGDGYIDIAEIIEAKSKELDIADKNSDGVLTLEEVKHHDSTLNYTLQ